MAEKVSIRRPDSKDPPAERTGPRITNADVNPDMARMRASEKFMDKSGTLAISSKLQIAHVAVLKAIDKTGFDLEDVIGVYESYEKRSPNLDGIGRSQSIQILTAPQVLIPGVGRMEGAYPDQQGAWSRFWGWLTGSGNNSNSQAQVQK